MTIAASIGLETCQILGQVSLNYSCGKELPNGYMWSGRRLTRQQLTSRPDPLWPELWDKNEKECEVEGEAKVVA